MNMHRRHLALAGAAAFGGATMLRNVSALADDTADITQAVETLRKAVLGQNKADLDKLTAAELSYGHSSAVVQTKAEFIDGVMNRKATVKSLDFPDLKVTTAGGNAIARHRYVSDSEQDGKPNHVDIGILEVWIKGDGGWKLLARQGYKLPS
jgi:uncharacterized protein DUF4440